MQRSIIGFWEFYWKPEWISEGYEKIQFCADGSFTSVEHRDLREPPDVSYNHWRAIGNNAYELTEISFWEKTHPVRSIDQHLED